MNFKACALLLFLFMGITQVIAQRSIQAFQLLSPITIDGNHEPEKWVGADSAISFFQMEPTPGEAASHPTVTYIGYDNENLYISGYCASLYQKQTDNFSLWVASV